MSSVKRILSGLLGFPVVAAVLILGNKYIIDIALVIIAIISMYEYMKCVEEKFKPVKFIGYLCAIFPAFLHIISAEMISKYIAFVILSLAIILFLIVIIRDMKTNFIDISLTFFGVIYIVGCISFLSLVYGIENVGKYYIWYIFIASWGCDIFAYLIGMKFGKHKFSKISPKKSIEGCVAGTLGGVILVMLYTIFLNNVFSMNINYIYIGIIGLILTIVGQIGDFAASSIKRYFEIKDFSNLIPGHGGMLDRIDSVILIAPYAYYLLMMFII